MKILIIQKQLSPHFSEEVEKALHTENAIIVLPEYFYFDPAWQRIEPQLLIAGQNALNSIANYSRAHKNMIIAGSIVEDNLGKTKIRNQNQTFGLSLVNRSYIFFHGDRGGFHTKRNLFRDENKWLNPGEEFQLISTSIGYVAVLICADVLEQRIFEKIRDLASQIPKTKENAKPKFIGTFCPTNSPRREESESDRQNRDRDIYLYGATITNAPVFKSCTVGTIRGNRVQGRSLIALPDGQIYNAKDIDTEEILEIDI